MFPFLPSCDWTLEVKRRKIEAEEKKRRQKNKSIAKASKKRNRK